jgi:hypothetical protein
MVWGLIKQMEKIDQIKTSELKTFKWEAPEFEKTEKEKSWFIMPAIVAIILCVFALLTDNPLFVVLVITGFLSFYVYANKSPRIVKFRIDEKGIEVDGRLHEYTDLRSFWLFYNPPIEKTLSLRSKKTFFPYIKIPLDEENPAEIRKYLLKFVPEKRHKESIIEILMKRIGF